MSGKLSKIMAVLLGIILVVGFVFKERITGSVAVYHHITTIHQALENGQDKLALNASIVQQKKENKKNSIDFTVRYEENSAFEGKYISIKINFSSIRISKKPLCKDCNRHYRSQAMDLIS